MRIARFPVNRGKNVLCSLVSAGNDADGEGTGYLRCGGLTVLYLDGGVATILRSTFLLAQYSCLVLKESKDS